MLQGQLEMATFADDRKTTSTQRQQVCLDLSDPLACASSLYDDRIWACRFKHLGKKNGRPEFPSRRPRGLST